jgi:hypothetical protein
MAHSLKIVYRLIGDAAETVIDLNDGTNYDLVDYAPVSPAPGADYVEEQAIVRCKGTTQELMLTAIQGLEYAFTKLKETRDQDQGYGYIYFDTPDTSVRLSPLYEGRIELNKRLLYGEDWANKATNVTLIWKRAPYSRPSGAESYALTNLNGTDVNSSTTGLNVFNCNDGSGVSPSKLCNYIDVTPTPGDDPTEMSWWIFNKTNDAAIIRKIHYAINAGANSDDAPCSLEFEDGTGGTETASAAASGGYYNIITWTEVVEKQIYTYPLDGANLVYYGGKMFKLFTKLFSALGRSDIYLKFKILNGTSILADSGWHLAQSADEIQEVGVLEIPPVSHTFDFSKYGNLTLALYAKCSTAGTKTLNGDFIQLMPVEHGIRMITDIIGELGYDDFVSDKGNELTHGNMLVSVIATTPITFSPGLVAVGERIRLIPGRLNRIYFLHDLQDGTAPINHKLLVGFTGHPRYRSI